MAELTLRVGDATRPKATGPKVIVHCCNNEGGWGSGFVVALSKRWDAPEKAYRSAASYRLGDADMVEVEPDLWVANLIGQDGIRADENGLPPIRYEAIRKGFLSVVAWGQERWGTAWSVHMPRIGCALAGGDWALVEPLVEAAFLQSGVDATVYDFPGGSYFDSRDPESSPFVR